LATIKKYPFLNELLLHSSKENSTLVIKDEFKEYMVVYSVVENVKSCASCGVINETYFTNLLTHYSESQKYNTCLNRKISVDINGSIKNCPSMKEKFGKLESGKFKETMLNPNFKKSWSINKDTIAICKDCEFRHVCTDCRAYIEDPKDIYSKPLKCGYNPYTNVWEKWSNNPLKKKTFMSYEDNY
jgi:SPASM domain peptide maturase of grasp-with-spasm system